MIESRVLVLSDLAPLGSSDARPWDIFIWNAARGTTCAISIEREAVSYTFPPYPSVSRLQWLLSQFQEFGKPFDDW